MSSYLNIYLVPKSKKETKKDEIKENETKQNNKQEPLLFCSFSRNNSFYQALNENMNIVFIGNDKEFHYTELTRENLQEVINIAEKDLNKLKEKKHIYELKAKDDESIMTLADFTEYYNEELENFHNLCFFSVLLSDILSDYTNFEKVLCNIS